MHYKNIKFIFLLFVSFSQSQSDNQIKRAKEIINQKGLNEAEVRSIARSQGYSNEQIDLIKQREIGAGKDSAPQNPKSDESDSKLNLLDNALPEQQQLENSVDLQNDIQEAFEGENDLDIIEDDPINIDSQIQQSRTSLQYFGYDIFQKDPALFQASSVGIVDPDYLIGPGDEIIVMLWGETQFRQVLTVNREGFIFIPEIGQVFVNGLNLNLLESKLFRVLSQSYASLNPQSGDATTFLDVSLGDLRPLRVQVLGQVSQPGAYTVSPSATLFSSLYYFNGPTTLGSLRDIRLIRGDEEIVSIDFYDYLFTGKRPKDEKLQLDDVIFIPKRLKTVTIEGEVNLPGIFELKPNETLKDIISMSGDLKITAYLDHAQIDRIVPFEQRDELGMDRMIKDVNLRDIMNPSNEFELQDGDKIQIFSVLDIRQNVVEIRGSVTRPGSYDIGSSLKLSELILKADSLLGDAYMDRVDIVRIKSDFSEELIKLDLSKALNKDLIHDIELQGMDRVRVYGMTEMISKSYVDISGHVAQPGRFPLQDNMTLYDLIFKAGGFIDQDFKSQAYLKRAELVRFIGETNKKKIIPFNLGLVLEKKDLASMLLQKNDIVRIYSSKEIEGDTRFVYVMGHAKQTGRYELFENNMTIYDLLFQSGGFEDPLHKRNTYLDRADLIRRDGDDINQSIISFNLGNVLSNKEDPENLTLKPEDRLVIYSKNIFYSYNKYVSVSGVVRNPGRFVYKKNMTLNDLILESGGIEDNVYSYIVEVARIDPNKIDEDMYAESFIVHSNQYMIDNGLNKVPIKSNLNESNFSLAPYDFISVRPDPFFDMQKKVLISGAVHYPGEYVILHPNEKIGDIINRAGGIKGNAFFESTALQRGGRRVNIDLKRILKKPKSRANILIRNGDEIIINDHPNMIQVLGEVSAPGSYIYNYGLRVNDVISQSGGFSQDANTRDIYIRFSNGKSKKYHRWFSNPKVLDGSVITVGRKPEEEPFDKTEYASRLTSIFANLAQAISMIMLART